MEIGEAVTSEYREVGPETRGSQLMGTFKADRDGAIFVVDDDGIAGIVTRKQLIRSQQDPDEKARSLMRRDVPRVDVRDDVREVARVMVQAELDLLPVYDGDAFEGAVTAESVAGAVEPFLDALDVSDVYTRDLRWVEPDTTLGEVIHALLVNGISRVPVIDDGDLAGMISFYDLLDFTLRETDQEQGGAPDGFDGHDGAGSSQGFRSNRGFGERAGVEHRMLDLPARDVMNSPVSTTGPTTPLGAAVDDMRADDYSSLVVEVPEEGADGIVTLTDVLRSLTWEPDDDVRLQVFGAEYLTDVSREEVAALIDDVVDKYQEMDVIEAYVVLHKHKERMRGTPLIQATIRLFTDRGRFAGTGEEYGDGPAIRAAKDRLERTVLDDKSHTIDDRRPQRNEAELEARTERFLEWWQES